MALLDIISQTYQSRSPAIDVRKLVNWYPEYEVEPDGSSKSKNVKALINCPGLDLKVTVNTDGEGRGLYTTSTGRMFGVVHTELFELDSLEASTTRGSIPTSNTAISFADNGVQMMLVDGANGYIYTLATNTLVKITDINFPSNPSHVIFMDGYFFVNEGGTGKFYYSDSYDGTSWEGLNFATAEFSADNLQGLSKTSSGVMWMIGLKSYELWQNVGTEGLPFRRIQGASREIGTIAKYSIATNGNQVFWLGSDNQGYGSIFMGAGYNSQRISTPAIEYQIKKLTNIANAEGYTYEEEGHSFYVLSFVSEKTYVFDVSTGLWHERGALNTLTGFNIRHRSRGHAFFNNKHYVGDFQNGKIYHLDLDSYDDSGTNIKREIITPCINDENQRAKYSKFELSFQRGVGEITDTLDPQIMLQVSNDGGRTWGGERWESAGAIGEYGTRAIWHRLGMARRRCWKIVASDVVKWIIVNAYIGVYR